MDDVLIFKIVVIIISGIIYLAIKGNCGELTDEKIKLNQQLLLKQRNSGILILYLRDFDVDGLREVTVNLGILKVPLLIRILKPNYQSPLAK